MTLPDVEDSELVFIFQYVLLAIHMANGTPPSEYKDRLIYSLVHYSNKGNCTSLLQLLKDE